VDVTTDSAAATVVLPASTAVEGPVLRLDEPFSFWGGVDPTTGRLTATRRAGELVTGRVLLIPETRGSSSSSAVLLELVSADLGPAALVLGEVDAIAGLGLIVAREMGLDAPPLLVLDAATQSRFADGELVRVETNGRMRAAAC